ncbi:hypothetical protein Q5424_24455 [Conexibacter sp. JD483]|uniref:hypothetical protein n=1 Tax=unclassified Conexibacter TaxID=2627773 RepID=UPI002720C4A5|nr:MULTISPECIES: hypothetical protein [unclassified Conexibacter]MDO8189214.1 hypothetical protein [Conexibacter sp. CPCC 205706]MDO8201354.1 hypothetical protein [Conexibacter sp. CPCC 205762]MDR9372273.1 hypothetical protein [Conexibacter sp. JD483]
MTHRVLEHRARAVVALLLALLAALTLAACGSDDDKGSSGGGGGSGGDTADAQTLLNDGFAGLQKIRSGKGTLSVKLNAEGEEAAIEVAGPFDTGSNPPQSQIDATITLPGGREPIRAGFISTGDKAYVEFQGSAYELSSELLREGTGMDRLPLTSVPRIDAQDWVTDPKVEGDEQAAGVDTTHVSGGIDASALMDSIDGVLADVSREGLGAAAGGQVPSRIPADARAQIERALRDPRIDVWVSKDDSTVRRMELSSGIEPEAGRSGDFSLSYELTDVNEPQTIEAPANPKPFDELLAGLGGLMSASGLGGAGAATPTAPSADDLSKYQKCLTDANGDVRKGQECEALLTGR